MVKYKHLRSILDNVETFDKVFLFALDSSTKRYGKYAKRVTGNE